MRPTEVLEEEHCVIEGLLQGLEATVVRNLMREPPAMDDFRLLTGLLSVFFGRWHRQKEQGLFFPLIEERGVHKEVIRAALMDEAHDSVREHLHALNGAAALAIDGNPSLSLWTSVHGRVLEFAAGVREHMEKEEEIVFPLAEVSLREEDRERLLFGFEQIERLDAFPGTRESIEKILEGREVGGAAIAGVSGRHEADGRWGGQFPVLVRSCA